MSQYTVLSRRGISRCSDNTGTHHCAIAAGCCYLNPVSRSSSRRPDYHLRAHQVPVYALAPLSHCLRTIYSRTSIAQQLRITARSRRHCQVAFTRKSPGHQLKERARLSNRSPPFLELLRHTTPSLLSRLRLQFCRPRLWLWLCLSQCQVVAHPFILASRATRHILSMMS